MKKSTRNTMVLASGALGAAWFIWQGVIGPRHEGRTAGQWFDQYVQQSAARHSQEFKQAESALLKLGTNAVPGLIRAELRMDRPIRWRLLERIKPHWPSFLRERHSRWEQGREPRERAAGELLRKIAPPGSFLAGLKEKENFPMPVVLWLAQFCGEEKEKLLPYLLDGLESTNRFEQIWALNSLTYFGEETPEAIEPLLKNDFYGTPHFRHWLRALAEFGPAAEPAVPKLRDQFHAERDRTTKLRIAQTLGRIDPNPRDAVRFLVENLPYPGLPENEQWRFETFHFFEGLGAQAAAAEPALLDQLDKATAPWLRIRVIHALKAIEANQSNVLGSLQRQGPPRNAAETIQRGQELLAFEPGHPRAVRLLSEFISTNRHAFERSRALDLLRHQGTLAREAVPALEKLAIDKTIDPPLRSNVLMTLSAIRMAE